jgi:uncharacterized membrane protein YeiB
MIAADLELTTERTVTRSRILGVDVARGLALLGMMAVHVYDSDGPPSLAETMAGGRAAATFAFVAGVSLTFLSGGRTPLLGPGRTAAAAGIAVRGGLIAVIGLLLAKLDATDVILAFYGLMFLLAIPFLGLRSRALALLAVGFAVLGPVLLVLTSGHGLPYEGEDVSPTLTMLVTDPVGMLAVLLLTGAYPVVAYLSYLFAGVAVGRLDLSSRHVARLLLGGGLTAAVLAKLGSAVLLYPLGGLQRLIQIHQLHTENGMSPEQQVLWDAPAQDSTWWHLALSSPHTNTPLDLLHTGGAAMAVLGAALLLTRRPVVARLLRPVAAAGALTLTLYSAHILILATDLPENEPVAALLVMMVGSLAFAVLWLRLYGQGPLERIVTGTAGATRRRVAARLGVAAQLGGSAR